MRDTAAAASLRAWLPGRNRRRLAFVLLATLAIAVLPVAVGRGRLPRRSWPAVASSTGARGLTDARALDPRSPRVFSDASSEPVAVAPADDDDFPQIQRETDPRVIRVPFPGHRPAGEANLIVIITPTYVRPTSKSPPQPNVLLRMYNALSSARGHQFLWILAQSRADASRANAALRLPEYDPDRHLSRVHVHTLAVDDTPTRRSTRPSTRAGTAASSSATRRWPSPGDRARLAAVARRAGFEGIDPETVDPVVYFGDDDNEYDPLLFDEMCRVRDIGVWPVGFPSSMRPHHVETVSVGGDGKVRGYFATFCDRRVYNLDMAAFAVRASVLGTAEFSHESRVGHIEDDLLREALGDDAVRRLEPLAEGATRVYVWHLGWKFDRDKGTWRLLHTVEQPAKILCEPLEIQERKHEEKMKRKKAREEEKKRRRETRMAYANASVAANATDEANAPSPSESEAFRAAEYIAEEGRTDAPAPSPSEAEEAETPAAEEEAETPAETPSPAESMSEGDLDGTIETRAKPSSLADDDGGNRRGDVTRLDDGVTIRHEVSC